MVLVSTPDEFNPSKIYTRCDFTTYKSKECEISLKNVQIMLIINVSGRITNSPESYKYDWKNEYKIVNREFNIFQIIYFNNSFDKLVSIYMSTNEISLIT